MQEESSARGSLPVVVGSVPRWHSRGPACRKWRSRVWAPPPGQACIWPACVPSSACLVHRSHGRSLLNLWLWGWSLFCSSRLRAKLGSRVVAEETLHNFFWKQLLAPAPLLVLAEVQRSPLVEAKHVPPPPSRFCIRDATWMTPSAAPLLWLLLFLASELPAGGQLRHWLRENLQKILFTEAKVHTCKCPQAGGGFELNLEAVLTKVLFYFFLQLHQIRICREHRAAVHCSIMWVFCSLRYPAVLTLSVVQFLSQKVYVLLMVLPGS